MLKSAVEDETHMTDASWPHCPCRHHYHRRRILMSALSQTQPDWPLGPPHLSSSPCHVLVNGNVSLEKTLWTSICQFPFSASSVETLSVLGTLFFFYREYLAFLFSKCWHSTVCNSKEKGI